VDDVVGAFLFAFNYARFFSAFPFSLSVLFPARRRRHQRRSTTIIPGGMRAGSSSELSQRRAERLRPPREWSLESLDGASEQHGHDLDATGGSAKLGREEAHLRPREAPAAPRAAFALKGLARERPDAVRSSLPPVSPTSVGYGALTSERISMKATRRPDVGARP